MQIQVDRQVGHLIIAFRLNKVSHEWALIMHRFFFLSAISSKLLVSKNLKLCIAYMALGVLHKPMWLCLMITSCSCYFFSGSLSQSNYMPKLWFCVFIHVLSSHSSNSNSKYLFIFLILWMMKSRTIKGESTDIYILTSNIHQREDKMYKLGNRRMGIRLVHSECDTW